jgi:hypothetical protein
MNAKQGAINIIIIAVVTVVIISAIGYVTLRAPQEPGYQLETKEETMAKDTEAIETTTTQPTTENETASWQTYRNNKYGFEMMYPKGFVVNFPNEQISSITDYNIFASEYERGNPSGLKLQVNVRPEKYLREQEVLRALEKKDEITGTKKRFAKEETKDFIIFKNTRWNTGGGSFLSGVSLPSHAIYNPINSKLVLLSIQDPSGKFDESIKQILSTFKFTN